MHVTEAVRGRHTLEREDISRGLVEMPERVRQRRVLLALAAAIGLFYSISGVLHGGGVLGASTGIWVFGALALASLALMRFMPTMLAKRQVSALRDAERDVIYEFDDRGVTILRGTAETRFGYEMIHRTAEGEKTFFVYTGPTFALFIPKRAFSSGDVEAVRRLLASKVEPRSRPGGAWRVMGLGAVIWLVVVLALLLVWKLLEPT